MGKVCFEMIMLSFENNPDALSKSKCQKKQANHSLWKKCGTISDPSRLTGTDTNSNLRMLGHFYAFLNQLHVGNNRSRKVHLLLTRFEGNLDFFVIYLNLDSINFTLSTELKMKIGHHREFQLKLIFGV